MPVAFDIAANNAVSFALLTLHANLPRA